MVLQTIALGHLATSPCLAAPRGFEPRFTDPKSGVLPLDEGAAEYPDSLRGEEGSGAEDGTRTRDPHLGKVMLYQLSHFRPIRTNNRPAPCLWCREPDSNWRHRDFQSRALPTELSRPAGAVRILDHILASRHNLRPWDHRLAQHYRFFTRRCLTETFARARLKSAEPPCAGDGGTDPDGFPPWGESRNVRAGHVSGRARQLTSQAKP